MRTMRLMASISPLSPLADRERKQVGDERPTASAEGKPANDYFSAASSLCQQILARCGSILHKLSQTVLKLTNVSNSDTS